MCASLVERSPVACPVAKAAFARRAVEAHRQCVQLDGMIRNPDEQRALNQSHRNFESAMSRLHVGEILLDPDDDESDDG